ncbi:MAG: NifB/NifX family molybdenum-iron cluster-binding protein [Gammaproteobacteria bacterium]|nr:NifB/NifX family molybdenum-iron cluster-binding protein [Gammaproteobacteria bacterium]
MKLAISSQGTGKDSHVDLRFGRARYFVIFNTRTGHVAAFSNESNLDAIQWAGIQAGGNACNH